MKNVIKEAGTISLRHERDDKPAGVEYLYADGNNPAKYHHVIISLDGKVFYNQAIKYKEITRENETLQPGGWQDFYEWTRVYHGEFHGYRKYIDQARDNAATERATRIEAGDTFRYWNNQAKRDAACLAVLGGEALIVFEMPNGNEYLHIIKAKRLAPSSYRNDVYQFVRNISWNNIPKKWARVAGL